eukprot:UN08535
MTLGNYISIFLNMGIVKSININVVKKTIISMIKKLVGVDKFSDDIIKKHFLFKNCTIPLLKKLYNQLLLKIRYV